MPFDRDASPESVLISPIIGNALWFSGAIPYMRRDFKFKSHTQLVVKSSL